MNIISLGVWCHRTREKKEYIYWEKSIMVILIGQRVPLFCLSVGFSVFLLALGLIILA
jgi:hypothetical protein